MVEVSICLSIVIYDVQGKFGLNGGRGLLCRARPKVILSE